MAPAGPLQKRIVIELALEKSGGREAQGCSEHTCTPRGGEAGWLPRGWDVVFNIISIGILLTILN